MDLTLLNDFQNYQAYGQVFSSNLPFTPWLTVTRHQASLVIEGHLVTDDLYNPEIAPLFVSSEKDRYGCPILHLYRLGEILYLKLPTVGIFFIGPDKIHVQIRLGTDLVIVCATVLSYAFIFWLEQHKTRCLHAATLCLHGRAIAFMADSTTGKSTLAAALMRAGAELLGDDVAPLMETTNGFMVSPAYPTMRLSKLQTERFLGTQVDLARWSPVMGKALIPVGVGGWGAYSSVPRKIQRLYVLKRTSKDSPTETYFERIPRTDAMLALIRFSFVKSSPLVLGIAVERMAFFARLVEQVDVVRMTYTSGYEHLIDVVQRIFEDIDKGDNI